MTEDLLSVRGKAMTKPVPLNEMDVKCALTRAKAIFVTMLVFEVVASPAHIQIPRAGHTVYDIEDY